MDTMATVHMTEAEAVADVEGLLSRVRAGTEVVIDSAGAPSVTVRREPAEMRLISEALRSAQQHGSTPRLDDEFANDLASIRASGRQGLTTAWD